MNPRQLHVNKSQRQRQDYWRYIENQDYEPTLDEKLRFPQTGQAGEELSEPSTKRRRRIRLSTRLADHLSENWLSWLFAIAALVLFWLTTESRIAMAKIEASVESTKDDLGTVVQRVGTAATANAQQDLAIAEQRIRLDYIQRELDKKK